MPFSIIASAAAAIGVDAAAAITAVTGVDIATATSIVGALGTAVSTAGIGAGIGGLESAVTGGNILKGAEKGGEVGGLVGLGAGAGGALLPGAVGTALGGAAGGALGGVATGGNVGLDAALGGITSGAGALYNGAGAFTAAPGATGVPTTTSSAGAGGGGATGAVAAPPSAFTSPSDVSSQFGQQAFDSAQGTNLASVAANPGAPAVSPTGGVGGLPSGGADTGSPGVDSFNTGSTAPVSQTPSLNTNAASLASNNSAPATSNIGTGTVGTQGLPDVTPAGLGVGSLGANYDPSTGITPSTTGGGGGNTPWYQGAINSLKNNALPVGIAGTGLVVDAIKNEQAIKGENEIKSIAAQEQAQGQTLQNYLQTGTLPPGLQAGLDQASAAAAASIKSQYAAKGMSGSSAEQQDLANLQQTVQSQGSQMALQLLQTGINETGMASSLYENLINETLSKDQQLGTAISSFASAAAGGAGNRVIQIPGSI